METVRWAAGGLWGDDPQQVRRVLDGCVQAWVKYSGRDTVARNVKFDPAKPRYARVPRGAHTCAWYAMLASRGFVYPVHHATTGEVESAKVVGARTGRKQHTTKGAVRLDDAFSVPRSREVEHEDEPSFIETEFATSRCGSLYVTVDTRLSVGADSIRAGANLGRVSARGQRSENRYLHYPTDALSISSASRSILSSILARSTKNIETETWSLLENVNTRSASSSSLTG